MLLPSDSTKQGDGDGVMLAVGEFEGVGGFEGVCEGVCELDGVVDGVGLFVGVGERVGLFVGVGEGVGTDRAMVASIEKLWVVGSNNRTDMLASSRPGMGSVIAHRSVPSRSGRRVKPHVREASW
jgi:hypothetical protein